MSAGRIIGRMSCPWCGFEGAHVKQAEGKHPYHHCPECGMLATCRNGVHASNMRARMRPVDQAATAAPAAPAEAPAIERRPSDIVVTPPAAPPATETPKPAKRSSPWAPLLGVIK